MKEYEFEKVNEKLYKETLENGIDVYLYPFDKTKNFYCTITVKFGARYTKYKKNNKVINILPGSAHFLEHRIMIVGEDKKISDRINRLGSLANAWTSNYATNYNIFGSENINENIRLLLDIFYNAKFVDKDVEEEKGIISEEIDMNKDKIDIFMHDKIFKNLFSNMYAKNTVIGEKDDINQINSKYLKMLYDDFYTPSNTFIVISGNFNKDDVMNTIKDYYKNLKLKNNKPPKRIKINEDENVNVEYEEINKNLEKPRVSFGFKMKKDLFKGYSDDDILSYIDIILKLNFTSISNLYEEYRNKGIIHSMSCYSSIVDDYVIVVFNSITSMPNKFIECIENDIKNMSIDKEKFEIFKRRLIKGNILTFENIEDVEFKIVNELTRFGKIDYNDYSLINKLNYKDCLNILSKLYFDNKAIIKTVK